MDAPTIPVSADSFEGNFKDAIDIGLDVDHPVPVVADAFPAVTIVTILASHDEAILGIHEYLQGVMDAPTLPFSVEKNLGDPIEIRVDIVHPAPANVFPTATMVRTLAQHGEAIRGIHGHLQGVPINEEMNALRFRMGLDEEENASLRGQVRYMHSARCCTNLVEWSCENLRSDTAYAMTWEILKKKLTNKYSPKGKTKKLEIKLWNLKVKGSDVGGYTQRFQELALMCTKFISNESEKVDKYISGLPDNIHGNVMSARPKTLDDAIELAKELMDQKLRTYAKRQAKNKRNLDNNNQAQQKLLKKQNVVQAYAVRTREKKPYGGSKPLCLKCNYHHSGECAPKCTNCKKIGHLTKDCWHPINAKNQRNITCYECGNQGHYKSDCPMLKNQGTEARGRVYALGGRETNQDLDNAVPTGRVVVPTGRCVVPTGRVVVPTGMYAVPTGRVVVPTGKVISPGRIPTG
nr:hypothetical protein [Tanacetum cinerariifolium]